MLGEVAHTVIVLNKGVLKNMSSLRNYYGMRIHFLYPLPEYMSTYDRISNIKSARVRVYLGMVKRFPSDARSDKQTIAGVSRSGH